MNGGVNSSPGDICGMEVGGRGASNGEPGVCDLRSERLLGPGVAGELVDGERRWPDMFEIDSLRPGVTSPCCSTG
jgi:hypothetical protein